MTLPRVASLVTIITPTYQRTEFLPRLWEAIQKQTWSNVEWLVQDDSPEPSAFMENLVDERVFYRHSSLKQTIGAKRNALVERARGEYIVHCDDDDYYAPEYIGRMIACLDSSEADLCKLSSFFLFYRASRTLAYWDLLVKQGMHFRCDAGSLLPIMVNALNNAELADIHLGFGFSYVYRRSVWGKNRFPNVDMYEDGQFVAAVSQTKRVVLVPDVTGLCLHTLHGSNASQCFPQFVLPPFLAGTLFPGAGSYL